jgi:hypothetical protein
MAADDALDLWLKFKIREIYGEENTGWLIHQREFGCKVTFYDIHFGTGSTGVCETCYYEYEALIYSATCTCPDKVPQTKNPQKMRKNPQKFEFKNHDIEMEPIGLADIINEVLSLPELEA